MRSRRLCCWRAVSAARDAGGQGFRPEQGTEHRAAARAEPDSSEGGPQRWLLLMQNLTALPAACAEPDAPAATASAAPPPPGGPAPAPPPPLAGNGSTTLVLEVYFSQVKDWLKMCQSRTLYFWATVSATTITTARVL